MIKVFINGEWLISFNNQEELNSWLQNYEADYIDDIRIEYEEFS